ncbi:unnamed protein product [Clonostachys rosea]|uniref:Major facilitator superfamily (MFS) profile domain-containing protein n=1 Tax=Bionectria ochroleuca TaxID=29856 RepID=A0ABY6UN56_BIOOC|nr:unnamed protein product [Clonostachys rosea]
MTSAKDIKREGSVTDGAIEEIMIKDDMTKHDKALALLAENDTEFDPKSAEAQRVLRKIDTRIMPLVLSVYILMLVDKNSLSYANIMGIKQETHLSASQYSWLGSIVYFGYLAGELPVAFLM